MMYIRKSHSVTQFLARGHPTSIICDLLRRYTPVESSIAAAKDHEGHQSIIRNDGEAFSRHQSKGPVPR